MISRVGIANLALAALSMPRITSLDEGSKSADALKAIYDAIRRSTLRAHPWNFAQSFATLQRLSSAPAWKWAYWHPVPSDFLRMSRVEGDPPFKIMRGPGGVGRVVCCDSTPLNIEFVGDVTVETEFDDIFVEAFALKLAKFAAPSLTNSEELGDKLEKEFRRVLGLARGVDAQENGFDEILATDWNDARN